MLERLRQRVQGVEVQHVGGRAVRVEADRGGGERRQRHRRAVGRLDARQAGHAHRRRPEQVLGRVGAVLAEALLVAQPRLEAGRVRHLRRVLDHGRSQRLAHPLLVLGHLLELLGDAHPALASPRLNSSAQVEGAGAEALDQLGFSAALDVLLRPVVHGALLRVR